MFSNDHNKVLYCTQISRAIKEHLVFHKVLIFNTGRKSKIAISEKPEHLYVSGIGLRG